MVTLFAPTPILPQRGSKAGSLRARHNPSAAIAPMLNKLRILVAEDESDIADTIQHVPAPDSFLPVWCRTAEQALREFAAEAPALVILDVGLSDLNGLELFKRLQALSIAASNRKQPGLPSKIGL